MKKKNVLSVFAILTFFISGCTLQFSTDIDTNLSGKFGFELIFLEEDGEMLSALDVTPQGMCDELLAEVDVEEDEISILSEERDDGTYVCATYKTFQDLDELAELYEDSDFVTINRLEVVDNTFYYDIDTDFSELASNDLFDLLDAMKITWKVTIPGNIESHNGISQDGSEIIWEFSESPQQNIIVESKIGANFTVILLIIGVVLLIALGIFVANFFLKKKRTEKDILDFEQS